tara:strand:+ start:9121 stop:9756 length:636 start_codon:yes stop_codon:yes gene_type:complete
MFVRRLFYPLINYISIRHIHTNPPSCYLSQKSIRNYINKGSLDVWDIYNTSYNEDNLYNIYTIEHIWPKSFLKNNLHSKHDLHNLGITSGFYNVHRSNYKYTDSSPIIYSLYKLNNNMISIQINDNNNLDSKRYNYKNCALKIFIPIESSRGEIARSILYMSNLYGKNNMDKIIDEKLLHQWNKKYPPTEREKKKNIQISKLQGNKNPFIN